MENELVKIFERANKRFLKENTAFILSNVAERSLCSTLAQCLYLEIRHSKYSRYYVDVEYNRNNGRVKTIYNDDLKVVTIICDLIVHSRGEIVEKDNLIALEMKKSYRPMKEKENDKARLVALTKDSYDGVWSFDGKTLPEHVCGYDLGIYYEIDSKNSLVYIEYYVKGKRVRTYEEKILRWKTIEFEKQNEMSNKRKAKLVTTKQNELLKLWTVDI